MCPRRNCQRMPVLPLGAVDSPRKEAVKAFCPLCKESYEAWLQEAPASYPSRKRFSLDIFLQLCLVVYCLFPFVFFLLMSVVCLFRLFACLLTCLFVCLFIFLFICLSVCACHCWVVWFGWINCICFDVLCYLLCLSFRILVEDISSSLKAISASFTCVCDGFLMIFCISHLLRLSNNVMSSFLFLPFFLPSFLLRSFLCFVL